MYDIRSTGMKIKRVNMEFLEAYLKDVYDARFWAMSREPGLFPRKDNNEESRKLGWTQAETAILQGICLRLGHPFDWLEGVCHYTPDENKEVNEDLD